MRRLEEDASQASKQDICKPNNRLELLPVEILEIISSYLRPADLVALAASFPQLEAVLRSPRLWRGAIVRLSSNYVRPSLRQIQLAPELRELAIGYGELHSEAVNAVSSYQGPIPYVRTLRLNLSSLGTELGVVLLLRHGPKTRHLELDLRHDPLEPPRDNITLIQLLPNLCNVESLIVRVDVIDDVLMLLEAPQSLVEIDIHCLRVGDVHRGGPGPQVGNTAAHLIFRHICHLQILRLPFTFDISLSGVVMSCRELRTLACNVWTLPAIEDLHHLQSLLVFPPDICISNTDLAILAGYAHRCRRVLAGLRELRFVNGGIVCGVVSPLARPEHAQAVMCILLNICRNLQVIEVEWKIGYCCRRLLDIVIPNNSLHLRELWLRGIGLHPRHFLTLEAYCPNLKILDIRMSNTSSDNPSKPISLYVTTKIQEGIRRAVTLLLRALPKLTILLDDGADNYYDWNIYLDLIEDNLENYGTSAKACPVKNIAILQTNGLARLFVHLKTLNEWSSMDFHVPQVEKDARYWRCATLDSSLWSTKNFIEILRAVPALGLLDCRNQKTLFRANKGHEWVEALAEGPDAIGALRIRTAIVSAKRWYVMLPLLQRIKKSLRFLELDFRGRPIRDWRGVLVSLGDVANLTELILRGSFDDEKPVLDWLHGRLLFLKRLDLRDCQMSSHKQMPAFLESLRILLLELRNTLRAVALPPLPLGNTSLVLRTLVLRTLGELADLRQVSLHADEIDCLRPLKALCALEFYGNRRPQKQVLLDRLAFNLRNLGSTLRGVKSLTLPVDLVRSHLVQEAILDVMPNLRKLHLIDRDRALRLCAEGPLCKNLMAKLL